MKTNKLYKNITTIILFLFVITNNYFNNNYCNQINIKPAYPLNDNINKTFISIIENPDNIILATNNNISTFSQTNNTILSTNSEIKFKNNISTKSEILSNIDEEIYYHDGIKFKKANLVGNFKLTGYCACKKCSSGTGITYSGKKVRANHTVAADLNVLPLGTYILLCGTDGQNVNKYNGIYQVEDKGGGVKNKHIDIYQPTHEEASQVTYHGIVHADVFIMIPIQ